MPFHVPELGPNDDGDVGYGTGDSVERDWGTSLDNFSPKLGKQ